MTEEIYSVFGNVLNGGGMEAEVIPFLSGEKIDFSKLDIVLLGGGSDREQELCMRFPKRHQR